MTSIPKTTGQWWITFESKNTRGGVYMEDKNAAAITWEEIKALWPELPESEEVRWRKIDDQIFNFIMTYLE